METRDTTTRTSADTVNSETKVGTPIGEFSPSEEEIVMTVYVNGSVEHNDRNYFFDDWDRAIEVAANRAAEGFRVKLKRRWVKRTDWQVMDFSK